MVRVKLIVVLIALGCLSTIVQSQSNDIIQILDQESEEPIVGATLIFETIGTITDLDGIADLTLFELSDSITISHIGYTSIQSTKKTLLSNSIVRLSISQNILNTAVITGSKYETSLAESIVSIDVLKPTLIQNSNTNNLEDIFNKIPGVQMVDGQPNIRNGSGWSYNAGNRVMLLLDDVPALQPDAGRAAWNDLPIENISQVEVVKGAGSALYGSAAMNGVVNVRTAYATSDPVTRLSVFHTRYGDYEDDRKNWYRTDNINRTPTDYGLSFSHKQKFDKLDVVFGAFYAEQDSTRSFRNQDFNKKLRANLNLRYRLSDRTTVGINTIVNKGNSSTFFLWRNATFGALQAFEGTVTRSDNIRYFIDPTITHFDKKGNRHKFLSRVYYNDNDNNLDQSNTSKMLYGEYQFLTDLTEKIKATFGVVGNRSTSDSEFFENADVNQLNVAGYGQFDLSLSEKLNLSGGLRYEYNKQNNGQIDHSTIIVPEGSKKEDKLIGRLGLNYEIDKSTFLRGSVGQAYRFPIMIERFLSTAFGGFVVLPNPNLESETGVTAELGIKKGLDLGIFKGYIDVAGYFSQYNNMMEFVFVNMPTFGFQSRNIGDTQITGIELSMAGRMTFGEFTIDLYGGANFSNPSYRDFEALSDFITSTSSVDENILKYRSRNSYTLDVQTNYENLSFGAAIQGSSHMIAIDRVLETFITDLGPYRRLNNSGFDLLDLRLGYQFPWAKVSLHAKNILNEEYTQRPGLIEAPRNFAIRLDFDL